MFRNTLQKMRLKKGQYRVRWTSQAYELLVLKSKESQEQFQLISIGTLYFVDT